MKVLFLESQRAIQRLVGDISYHHESIEISYDGEKKYSFNIKGLEKYDVVVNFNYSNPLQMKMIYEVRKRGIVTLLLQDGVYDWANSYINNNPYLYDIIFHDIFAFFGTLRDESWLRSNMVNPKGIVKYVPNYIKEKDFVMEEKKYDFLITTANKSYFNNDELDSLVIIINKTISELIKFDLTYKLRIFDNTLLSRLDVVDNVENDVLVGFSDCVKNVNAVITTKSTLIFESISLDLPVGEFVYRDTPILSSAAWCIHSNVHFKNTFSSMLSRDEKRMKYQNSYLRECMVTSTESDIESLVSNLKISEIIKRKLVSFIKMVVIK